MKFASTFAGVAVVGLAMVAAATSFGGSKAEAAGATVSCTVPNHVVCDISHPDGIANVTVAVDFGDLGVINVVDTDYENCPDEVTVSWDPIVPNADIQVTACDSFGLVGGGKGDGDGELGLKARDTSSRGGDSSTQIPWDNSAELDLPDQGVQIPFDNSAELDLPDDGKSDTDATLIVVNFGGPTDLVAPIFMDICHEDKFGNITVMTINVASWDDHAAHGDGIFVGYDKNGSAMCLYVDFA